jgi:hypothetical protein
MPHVESVLPLLARPRRGTRIEAVDAAHPVDGRADGRVIGVSLTLGAAVAAGDVLVELERMPSASRSTRPAPVSRRRSRRSPLKSKPKSGQSPTTRRPRSSATLEHASAIGALLAASFFSF